MSRNNKNARQMAQAREMSKRRQARRASGNRQEPGRAAPPNHGKKNAWWQKGLTYSEFLKGGGKKQKSKKAEAGVIDVEINAELV